MRRPYPSINLVKELLRLEPETGRLFWRERHRRHFTGDLACWMWNGRWAGKEAFSAYTNGYRGGYILGVRYPAHRVVFALHHGRWPEGDIDHVNGVRDDNRPENLRDVPHVLNQQNATRRIDNKSGKTGVRWSPHHGRWLARITVAGRRVSLGNFTELSAAIAARLEAERVHGFHANHGRERQSPPAPSACPTERKQNVGL